MPTVAIRRASPGALPAGRAARLVAGLVLPLRGAGWLAARRPLWRLALVPAALTLAGLVAGLAAGVPLSARALALFWDRPSGWTAPLWWLTRAALVLFVAYVAAVALPAAASGPFMDALSARVEDEVLGPWPRPAGGARRAAAEAATSAGRALWRTALLALGLVLLLPAALVPFAWPVLSFLWTARWTAIEWVDVPMARHLHPASEVRAALEAARPYGLGMGATLAAGFLVPLANLVVLPIGAVSGTLLYCDLVRAGIVARR